jgi:hypothetical protein
MMKIHLKFLAGAIATLTFAWLSASSLAATIAINFAGMDLVYDGSAIYDAGANAGGNLDPAEADPLTTVDFFVDNSLAGSLSSDISLDAFIPDVTGISDAPNTNYVQTTPGNPGFFDLLIGTSPLAAQYIALDLGEVTVAYNDVLGLVQLTFGAAVADSAVQNLPFGLQVGQPVTVSFSAQVVPGTRTTGGGLVTGFEASGTGEIQGPLVPEPAAGMLAVIGSLATMTLSRRRARRPVACAD